MDVSLPLNQNPSVGLPCDLGSGLVKHPHVRWLQLYLLLLMEERKPELYQTFILSAYLQPIRLSREVTLPLKMSLGQADSLAIQDSPVNFHVKTPSTQTMMSLHTHTCSIRDEPIGPIITRLDVFRASCVKMHSQTSMLVQNHGVYPSQTGSPATQFRYNGPPSKSAAWRLARFLTCRKHTHRFVPAAARLSKRNLGV